MPLKKQPLQPRSLPIPLSNWVRDMICVLEKAADAAKESSHSSPCLGEDVICALEKAADAAKEPYHSSP